MAEGVRLVDEEDAARRALARGGGEVPRLALVRAAQVAPPPLAEVALPEFAKPGDARAKALFLLLGYAGMSALAIWV